MVQLCCVPGCSNCSDRETHLSFHRLPLKRKLVLKKWIHRIGRRNLPLLETTRVCSEHFENSRGRLLRWDEVPSLKLPLLPTQVTESTSRRPLVRHIDSLDCKSSSYCNVEDETMASNADCNEVVYCGIGVNTDLIMQDIESLELKELNENLKETESKCQQQLFCVENIRDDDSKVKFYTGFTTFSALMICFNILGPSVDNLTYRSTGREVKSKKGQKRKLSPINKIV